MFIEIIVFDPGNSSDFYCFDETHCDDEIVNENKMKKKKNWMKIIIYIAVTIKRFFNVILIDFYCINLIFF